MPGARGVVVLAALAALAAVGTTLLVAPAAVGATVPDEEERTLTSSASAQIVRVQSVLDHHAARRMTAGSVVAWDITVSASRDDGRIDVSLDGTAPPDSFTVRVRECAVRWTSGGCAAGERHGEPLAAGREYAIAQMPSSETRWYRLEVVLDPAAPPDATAQLVVRAVGSGDSQSGSLPSTGGALVSLAGPAVGAIAVGLGLAGAARRRRERAS